MNWMLLKELTDEIMEKLELVSHRPSMNCTRIRLELEPPTVAKSLLPLKAIIFIHVTQLPVKLGFF